MTLVHALDYLWRILISYFAGLYFADLYKKRRERLREARRDERRERTKDGDDTDAGPDADTDPIADFSASCARSDQKRAELRALSNVELQHQAYAFCLALGRIGLNQKGREALRELEDRIYEFAMRARSEREQKELVREVNEARS